MIVRATYQENIIVTLQSYKKLMLKAMYDSPNICTQGEQNELFNDYYKATKEEDTKSYLKLQKKKKKSQKIMKNIFCLSIDYKLLF